MAIISSLRCRWAAFQPLVLALLFSTALDEKCQGQVGTPAAAERKALLGLVTDPKEQPIASADVFVIAFRRAKASYTVGQTQTDENGHFELADAYPVGEASVVDVIVYKASWAFSQRRVENESGKRLEDQAFVLEPRPRSNYGSSMRRGSRSLMRGSVLNPGKPPTASSTQYRLLFRIGPPNYV